MSITIITVNYHTESFLPALLESLTEQITIEAWIIVDNSGTFENSLSAAFPIRIISQKNNPGYAKAVNLAVRYVNTRWALLVNPDALLLPGMVQLLREAAVQFSAPVSGPRFFWDNACRFRMPPALGDHPWLATALIGASQHFTEAYTLDHYWQLRHDHFWRQTTPFYEPFLSGACLLLDLQWFENNSEPVFDDRFFLYYEDTDLCMRLLQHQIQPLCVPEAQMVHYYNQSPAPASKKQQLMAQARAQFYKKHFGTVPAQSSISTAKPAPEPALLGEFQHSPEFTIGKESNGPLYFEISHNPWFIPFIQTQTLGNTPIILPDEVWQQLEPGRYYTRLRHPTLGTQKTWQWNKI